MSKSIGAERVFRSMGTTTVRRVLALDRDLVRPMSKEGRISYRIRLAVVVLLLALISATAQPSQAGGWFFSITPPHGQTYDVGPYKNHYQCNDMDGSALYSHPFACHLTGLPKDCRIIGNGFAYPKGTAFPVPLKEVIPSRDGCFLSNQPGLPRGKYFFFYTNTGGSVEECADFGYFNNLAKTIPGDKIATTRKNCGGPCFTVGTDTACE
jgi:hypothetical protein